VNILFLVKNLNLLRPKKTELICECNYHLKFLFLEAKKEEQKEDAILRKSILSRKKHAKLGIGKDEIVCKTFY
jgi:hypothetical protein